MKRTQPLLLAISIPVALLAGSAFAQISSGPSAVTNSPYSIVEEIEHTQTLSDGTHISDKSETHLYRDSYGRTRVEIPYPSRIHLTGLASIEISDPLAGKRYFLNVRERNGQVIVPLKKLPVNPNVPPPPPPPIRSDSPKITHEDLGAQIIQGLLARGERYPTTVPVDSEGNDRPLVTVRETWMSSDLGRPVFMKVSDPRNGETITRLVSIDRSEPDPSLFQVPPDYVLRDPNQQ